MKTLWKPLAVLCLVAGPAQAAEFKCAGNRVEKAGSTQYTVRRSGADLAIEKDGSVRGQAVRRGDIYVIEVRGNPWATIENGRIYKGSAPWASVSDAQRVYDCPDIVAATIWVLEQQGAL